MNFVQELKWRGMIQDMTPGTEEQLQKELTSAYLGIDPTADSLHIGHLVGVMMLRHFQQCAKIPVDHHVSGAELVGRCGTALGGELVKNTDSIGKQIAEAGGILDVRRRAGGRTRYGGCQKIAQHLSADGMNDFVVCADARNRNTAGQLSLQPDIRVSFAAQILDMGRDLEVKIFSDGIDGISASADGTLDHRAITDDVGDHRRKMQFDTVGVGFVHDVWFLCCLVPPPSAEKRNW